MCLEQRNRVTLVYGRGADDCVYVLSAEMADIRKTNFTKREEIEIVELYKERESVLAGTFTGLCL